MLYSTCITKGSYNTPVAILLAIESDAMLGRSELEISPSSKNVARAWLKNIMGVGAWEASGSAQFLAQNGGPAVSLVCCNASADFRQWSNLVPYASEELVEWNCFWNRIVVFIPLVGIPIVTLHLLFYGSCFQPMSLKKVYPNFPALLPQAGLNNPNHGKCFFFFFDTNQGKC